MMKSLAKREAAGNAIGRFRGFTLIEILIVVIILGILASIIIPKFSNATVEAKESMLKENLRILRTQVGAYRAQHWDTSPGYDATTGNPGEQAFIDQMTMFTAEDGSTSDVASDVYRYGPYLREMPENPINHSADITIVADGDAMPAQATDNGGWIFKPADIVFRSDVAGSDASGNEYYGY